MVEGMSVVVNVMLSLMSVMSPPPALCNLSAHTVVKLCTLGVFALGVSLVSEMLQVKDAELVGAKGLIISTALDCFHYYVCGECSCHLQCFPLGFPRHYPGLS